jgi:hypothetical protein
MSTENPIEKLSIIEGFKIQQLPELQGKKSEILAIIQANPFIEVTDTQSFNEAKKARTALKTARTDVEKEQKTVLLKIKTNILNVVDTAYNDLIDTDIKPFENKQQAEVKRWEKIKEDERLEAIRLDEIRKSNHVNNIRLYYNLMSSSIETLRLEDIEGFELQLIENGIPVDSKIFEEYEVRFLTKCELLKIELANKTRLLKEKEVLRLEQVAIQLEKDQIAEQKKLDDEKQEAIDLENARLQKELDEKAEQLRIDTENFAREQKAFNEQREALEKEQSLKALEALKTLEVQKVAEAPTKAVEVKKAVAINEIEVVEAVEVIEVLGIVKILECEPQIQLTTKQANAEAFLIKFCEFCNVKYGEVHTDYIFDFVKTL